MGQNWTDCFACPTCGSYRCPEGTCLKSNEHEEENSSSVQDTETPVYHLGEAPQPDAPGCRGIFIGLLIALIVLGIVASLGLWYANA